MANNVPDLVTPELISLYESAGFNPCCIYDPKTVGLVKKNGNTKPCLKNEIKKTIYRLDLQNAINRYKWYNLPSGLSSQLIERILYFKGQGAFFYIPTNNSFYFLPYALNGNIDCYGRFLGITPISFGSVTDGGKDKPFINGLIRKPVYDVVTDLKESNIEESCVLLSDYCLGLSQTNIPRAMLQEPIIDAMSEAFPLARTSLIANSGVRGIRVGSTDEQANVEVAAESTTGAALEGKPWIPILGSVEFQDITSGKALNSSEYLQYMQALDNYRLSLYGLKNGGIFEKDSAYVNTVTAGNIQSNVGLVYQDGLSLRQQFCDIVNSIWGLGIWCEASETVTGVDTNMDGVITDEQDQTGEQPGEQPEYVEVDNE